MVAEGTDLALSKSRPTPVMRRALGGTVVLFGAVITTQVVLHLAVLVLLALVTGASEILLHTDGLDTETFTISLYVGLASALALMIGIQARVLVRRARVPGTDDSAPMDAQRRVRIAALILLLALVVVTLLGWHRSAFFPYPLATIVVVANTAFFGVLGPAWLGRAGVRLTRRLFEIGARSQYIAGAMTAGLVLLSAGGLWSANVERRVISAEIVDERARGRFDVAPPTSFADASEKGLCLVGDVLQPALADRTPGCGFTQRGSGAASRGDGGGRPSDDCTKTLHDGPFQRVQATVARQFGLSEFDANEVATRALLITCTKEPPPDDIGAYFRTVAKNEAARFFPRDSRLVSCDDELDGVPDICTAGDSEELTAEKAAVLWERVECELGPRVMRLVRLRVVDDLPFAEIGDRIRVSEDTARNMFHNALKKIRRLGIADCFRE